jgi:DNA-binding NtrC family response regulator
VVTLSIPPLRERKEDIAVLVDSYLEYFRGHIRRNVNGITPEALEALCRYDWPGNVRELVNIIERAMLLVSGDKIRPEDLPGAIRTAGSTDSTVLIPAAPPAAKPTLPPRFVSMPLREAREQVLMEFEKAYLTALLRETGGKIGETARRAGMEPRSLFDKLKRHGLRKEEFRSSVP